MNGCGGGRRESVTFVCEALGRMPVLPYMDLHPCVYYGQHQTQWVTEKELKKRKT